MSDSNQQLAGKTCIITGGAGSIGLATARLFIEHGARVMLVDLDAESLRQAAAGIGSDRVAYAAADVGRAADVQRYVDATVGRWGSIDVLFSNAGNSGVVAPLAEYPDDDFDAVYRVHVKGAFLACKYTLPHMNRGGSIVITSSVAGLRGDAGVYAYITAKHAQIGLMRSVSKEAARVGVRVNTIHPGPTDNQFQAGIERNLTPIFGREAGAFFDSLIPLGRHARPEEIAQSVLYLASPQSSFTTGSILVVDGGMSA